MQVQAKLKNVELGRKFIKAKIPSEWNLSKLGKLTSVHGRIGWRGLMADEYQESGPIMLSVWSLVENSLYGVDYSVGVKRLSQFRYEESPEIKLQDGDVLVTKDGDIGRNLPEPSTVNSHVVVVRTKNQSIENQFLYWYLKAKFFQTYCVALTSGTTVPLLSQKNLKDAVLILPSSSEQQKIASILSNIDSLIQQTEKLIEKTKIIKKGLMQTLFTKGIGHTKFKKVPFIYKKRISIPEEWNFQKLSSIIDLKNGFAFKSEYFVDNGENVVITPGNFHKEGRLHFEPRNTIFYNGPIPDKYVLNNEDLLIVMTDLTRDGVILGNAVILQSNYRILHNQRIAKVLFKNKFNKVYLNNFLTE